MKIKANSKREIVAMSLTQLIIELGEDISSIEDTDLIQDIKELKKIRKDFEDWCEKRNN